MAEAAAPASASVPVAAAAVADRTPDCALDRRFTALLVACDHLHANPLSPAERGVLDRLAILASGGIEPNIVPRLPAVLPRLIGLTRRADTSPRELTALLARDPALVGEVMRLANSSYYRASRDIANLQDAVMVLGQMGLSQLVTRAAMRPIFGIASGRFGRHAGEHLWQWSEMCARASSALRRGQVDQFSAYLAGTVAPVGLMAALRVLDQDYPSADPPASEAFHRALWRQTAELSAHAARQWDLPDEVVQALSQRAGGTLLAEADPLALAVQGADRAARRHLLAIDVDDGMPEAELLAYSVLGEQVGMAEPA